MGHDELRAAGNRRLTDYEPKVQTMHELDADALFHRCDPETFSFRTTDELAVLDDVVGQQRAIEAIRFGIGIEREGFNLFAIGPSGIGKHHLINQFLRDKAVDQPTPPDWIYVHDFDRVRSPRAIEMAPGVGRRACQRVDRLLTELEVALRSVFENDDFRARRRAIHHEHEHRREAALQALADEGREAGLALSQSADGFTIAPVREGSLVSPDALEALPESERLAIEQARDALGKRLRELLDEFPKWERELTGHLVELEREAVAAGVEDLFTAVEREFEDAPVFVEHLERVRRDVIDNPWTILPAQDAQEAGPPERATALTGPERYQVNLLVDNGGTDGAPIFYEDDPTLDNLVGRIEYEVKLGALVTHFGLIREGSLHRANGGYLIVDARKLLANAAAWDVLKRTLYAGEIRVDSGRDAGSQPTTLSLAPDPIPLDIKIVLVGERGTYYTLREFDPDIDELFKVMADFDTETERTDEVLQTYARLIATLVNRDDLAPFDRCAVARVIEHSSRLAHDSTKLSLRMRTIADLLAEADHWAEGDVVTAGDVQKALDQQDARNGRIRDELAEQISDGTVVIPTDGLAIGRINGLSVLAFGQSSFGRPSRISASVAPGTGSLVDIERAVELGGPIHSKGVMILHGFLAGRYATDFPLLLSASIVFEQSYGPVDGDSASGAETCALLSAIGEFPLRQSIAMTGAMDQYGAVRAVGGVNDKVEGFFDVCMQRGLDGSHGVIMPSANIQELMLRAEVVDAVRAGQFHIWPVEHVDEALALLSGRTAEATSAAIRARLEAFAAIASRYHRT